MVPSPAPQLPAAAPTPFEIREDKDARGARVVVAANGPPGELGTQVLLLMDPTGTVVRRRAVKGLALAPAADVVVPMLNKLATEIVEALHRGETVDAAQLQARLMAMASMVPVSRPTPVEWCMATIDGVHVYLDGHNVVVTRRNLGP